MEATRAISFLLGDWLVDPRRGLLRRGAEERPLRPREMDLLIYLANRPGEVVTADDILAGVWRGVVVGTDALYFSVSQLRKALGDDPQHPEFLETVPKRGYRLLAEVRPTPDEVGSVVGVAARAPSWLDRLGKSLGRRAAGVLLIGTMAALIYLFAAVGERPQESPSPPSVRSNSIAVMPFVDLSRTGDQAYLGDGIAEELLQDLSRVEGLQVAARTSSFSFKGQEPSIPEIGRVLGVAHVLEGSIRRENQRLRIAAQLVDAENGFTIWSETYERELSSFLAIQQEISGSIVSALLPELALHGAYPGADRDIDERAYDHYLKGLQAVAVNSYEALADGVAEFQAARDADPTFAPAYAELANARLVMLLTGALNDVGVFDEAAALANRALGLDPENPRAHIVLGRIAYQREGSEAGKPHFRRALELAPGNTESMVALATCLSKAEESDRASALFARALKSDPLNPQVHIAYGMYQKNLGRVEEALTTYRRAVQQNPRNPNLHWLIGHVHAYEFGDMVSAIASYEAARRLDPNDHEIDGFMSLAYTSLDMPELAARWAEKGLAKSPDSAFLQAVWAQHLVSIAATADALELARQALGDADRYYSHGSAAMLTSVGVAALVDRGDLLAAEALALDTVKRLSDQGARAGADGAEGYGSAGRAMVALAEVYRRLGREDAMAEVLDGAGIVGTAADPEVRGPIRKRDYLLRAQIRAIRGDADGALEMLEQSVRGGIPADWQSDIQRNPIFDGIRNRARFGGVMDAIAGEIARQRPLIRDQVATMVPS